MSRDPLKRTPNKTNPYVSEANAKNPVDCWMCGSKMRWEATMDFRAWYHCGCGNYEHREILQDTPAPTDFYATFK